MPLDLAKAEKYANQMKAINGKIKKLERQIDDSVPPRKVPIKVYQQIAALEHRLRELNKKRVDCLTL